MTNVSTTTRNLHAFLKKLEGQDTSAVAGVDQMHLAPVIGEDPEGTDPARELVYSLLVWEAGASKAAAAARRLQEGVVDINELRLCLEDEIVRLIGPRYPRAAERAARLRAALNHVFHDAHTVSLAHLKTMSKREARTYLEAITGMPPFATARVLLLSLGGHAFPIDRRLHRVLAEEEAVEPATYDDAAGVWAERQIRAGDARDAYLLLEAYAEAKPAGARRTGGRGRDADAPRRKTSDKPVS